MKKVFNRSWFDFDAKDEFRDAIIVGSLAFLIPLFLGELIRLIFGENSMITSNSAVIIGTIINSLLIVSALNFKGLKKIIPVIILPSVGILISETIFDSSVSIKWMVPGIWIGNYIFVYLFKWLMFKKKFNYFLTGLVAVIAKTFIIFGIFSILNALGVFAVSEVEDLKYLMGAMQVFSGITGVLLGYLIYTSYRID